MHEQIYNKHVDSLKKNKPDKQTLKQPNKIFTDKNNTCSKIV